jgi:hypothetical protein
VEYGAGPHSLTARWEGRPDTPPFQWGDEGVVLPSHNLWLQNLDMQHENLEQLVDHGVRGQDPGAAQQDLDAVKALLMQHAGSLQATFLVFECQVREACFGLVKMTVWSAHTMFAHAG